MALFTLGIAAGVEAYAIYPRFWAALGAEIGESPPQVYQNLLEKVVDLVLVVGKEVADCVYCLAVLFYHCCEFCFNIIHRFIRFSTLLDTEK